MPELLRPGSELDDLLVGDVLGRGASAVVYAVRTPAGEDRALKVLEVSTDRLRARLERELRALLQVRHPNVVRVYELRTVGSTPALVLERVRGPTLAEWLGRGLPELEVASRLFAGILEGTGALHRAGLVHRDLKPANVLLERRDGGWLPRVSDLGLVRGVDHTRLTATGAMLGTPAYMAPEQVRDPSAVDARADVFSLGAILFEMCCGRPPFSGDDLRAVLNRAAAGSFPSPAALRPGLSPATVRAIAGALCPDPAGRIPDVDTLQAVLAGTRAWSAEAAALHETWGDEGRGRVPVSSDAFCGREADLARLQAALARSSVVTLWGPGGVGKSRLARELGQRRLEQGRDTWFCDLSHAADRTQVVGAIARTLEVPLPAGAAEDRLQAALAARAPLLLILDQAEHVGAEVAALASAWQREAPDVRVLATSREPVDALEAQTVPLGPLDATSARALFFERARQVQPELELDAERVAQLVDRLDRLPLAIELAAAGWDPRGPIDLALPLHATLRACIAWSYERLEPPEQAALRQLSVLAGPWEPTTGAALLDLHRWPDADPRAVVERLVRCSLLHRVSRTSLHAYAAIRRFGREELERAGPDERDAALERHASLFAGHGTDEGLISLAEHGEVPRRRQLREALPDLVVGARCVAAPPTARLGCLRAAVAVLADTGPAEEALRVAESDVGPLDPADEARLLHARGVALRAVGSLPEAAASLDRSARVADAAGGTETAVRARTLLGKVRRELGAVDVARVALERALRDATGAHPVLGARARIQLAASLEGVGDVEAAVDHYERAVAELQEAGNLSDRARALNNLAGARMVQHRTAEATQLYEAAIALHAQTGNRRSEGIAWGNVALVHQFDGRLDRADACLRRALGIARDVGNRTDTGATLTNIGNVARLLGDFDRARTSYREARTLQRAHGQPLNEAISTVNLGWLAWEQGDTRQALVLAGQAHAAFAERSHPGVGFADMLRALVAVDAGDPSRAQRICTEARVALGNRYLPGVEGRLWLAEAAAHLARGDGDATCEALDRADLLLEEREPRCLVAVWRLAWARDHAPAELAACLAEASERAAAVGLGPGSWARRRIEALSRPA